MYGCSLHSLIRGGSKYIVVWKCVSEDDEPHLHCRDVIFPFGKVKPWTQLICLPKQWKCGWFPGLRQRISSFSRNSVGYILYLCTICQSKSWLCLSSVTIRCQSWYAVSWLLCYRRKKKKVCAGCATVKRKAWVTSSWSEGQKKNSSRKFLVRSITSEFNITGTASHFSITGTVSQ